MAGGTGTRFWPASTLSKPKQFLNLFGNRSLLQNTVDRISELVPLERNIIVTNDRYSDLVKEQLPDLPEENIIGEPVGRNTAPCVALAAAFLQKKDPEATMIVLPADHFISDEKAFRSYLKTAVKQAEASKNLVTIGIKPNRPETGYGYIQFDMETAATIEGNEVHKVKTFTEKPDQFTAEKFIQSGDFLWNSGMFVWKASTILEQVEKHLPQIHTEVEKVEPRLFGDTHEESINDFYRNCISISIDYGIMEKAETVHVVPGEFGWNDVGSWKAVYELGEKDKDDNVVETPHATLYHAHDNYVKSKSDKMIALVGVDNVAVVETDKAFLVCNLNESQGVKKIIEALKQNEETKKYL